MHIQQPFRKLSKRYSTSSSSNASRSSTIDSPPSEKYDCTLSTPGSTIGNGSIGQRIILETFMPISDILSKDLGDVPTFDIDGSTPVYVVSAHIGPTSVHPCKFVTTLGVRIPYGDREVEHMGRFDLLLIDYSNMEWLEASHGRIPPGRKAVLGGHEEDGRPLYHAMAYVNGVSVPGKTGIHLGACHVAFGCNEVKVEKYHILCWR